MKIIFFIETLRYGGKERRLLELISFLKDNTNFEILLVLNKNEIHYSSFFKLNIPYVIIERKLIKKDPLVFYKFFKVCNDFKIG